MLSFPRRRRGKDNRQLYSIPDITSFILVYQRDNHNMKNRQRINSPADFFRKYLLTFIIISQFGYVFSPSEGVGTILKKPFCITAIRIKIRR